MVQLHVSEDTIKSLLSSARQSLGDKATIIERLYYNLLSDTNVTSLSTIHVHHVHLEKARRILKWMIDNGIDPEKIDRNVLKRYIMYLKTEKKVTQSTLKTYVRVLRRLLKVLDKEELVKYIKHPKEKTKTTTTSKPPAHREDHRRNKRSKVQASHSTNVRDRCPCQRSTEP